MNSRFFKPYSRAQNTAMYFTMWMMDNFLKYYKKLCFISEATAKSKIAGQIPNSLGTLL
jgi:hypothetical protein